MHTNFGGETALGTDSWKSGKDVTLGRGCMFYRSGVDRSSSESCLMFLPMQHSCMLMS
jgi:hypothetical protein